MEKEVKTMRNINYSFDWNHKINKKSLESASGLHCSIL